MMVAGLIVGAAGSAVLNTGCSCGTTGPVRSGTYGPLDLKTEVDYRMTISADQKAVTETFTRASGSWEIDYATNATSQAASVSTSSER
jgi:hypothetical protein